MGAYGSEVKATLGVDTTQVPQDMAKAREAFNKAAQEIQNDSAKHGAGAGDKLIGALEHKLTGARHLGGVLSTALGLNLENIAEHITAAITDGSLEGWKRAEEIAERDSEVIGKIIEAKMNPAQLQGKIHQDLEKALREQKESVVTSATAIREAITGALPGGAFLNRLLGSMGVGQTGADIAEARNKKKLAVDEASLRIAEEEKTAREQIAQLDDQIISAQDKKGTLAEREASVTEHIKKLQLDYVNGNFTELELKKKELEIQQKQNELAEIHKEQAQHDLEIQKKTVEIEEKRAELAHQRVQLGKDESKLTDRSKLTVGELAVLHTNKHSAIDDAAQESERTRSRAFEFGRDADLTSEQAAARDKAEEIKDLEAKAERARRSGDSAGASSILDQVGQMRDSLVKSGFTKSTEGDPATALKEQIAKDNDQIKKTLSSIETIEKGKYVNQ